MKRTFFTKQAIFFIFISVFFLSPTVTIAQWAQLGLDIDGEANLNFSGSVSINAAGDRLAIGAQGNNGNGNGSGHVRVYEWNGVAWAQLGLDIDGEAAGDKSGAVSINATGDRLAIGAFFNDGNGSNSGHVRVYEWSGVNWMQLGSDIDGEVAGDLSGSVSINAIGNRLAIGASSNDANGLDAGHVRVYEWSGVNWMQLGSDIDGEVAGDFSGGAVEINSTGNRLAVGSVWNDGNGIDAGRVRVFEWDGISWAQLGMNIDGEAAGDGFGYSMSMDNSGNILAVGAPYNDGNAAEAGHVQIYEWDGVAWSQLGVDIDGDSLNYESGCSVALNGDGTQITIGARGINGNIAGKVRTYLWDGFMWNQRGSDINGEALGDLSGYDVSSDSIGDRIAIGAPENGGKSGHVRVYQNNLTTGIGKEEVIKFLSIYPNPANENLTIESQKINGETAQITNVTGALILEFKITKEKESLDIRGFENGIYFLKTGGLTTKIIVAR